MKDAQPVTISCVECGIRFVRVHPSQKYCAKCAAKKKTKKHKETKKDGIESFSPRHVPSMVPAEKEGWSTHGKSLRLLAVEAREFGMSYGQYMSAIQSGTIEKILTAHGMTPSEWRAKLRAAKRKVR